MIVSVIGLGYIGLPTAAVLSSNGIKVIGVDVKQKIIDLLNQGKVHIMEPGLDLLIHDAIKKKLLKVVRKPEKSNVFIIAVPTPFKNNYEPDLSFIESAVKSIAPFLTKGNLVILESTSPVGTTENMIKVMENERPELIFPKFGKNNIEPDINIAYCPERVLPGQAIQELSENARIVGGVSKICAEKAVNFYKIFVKSECVVTDCRTAELTKLVENSYRDVNIAFANELSLICDKLNINVWQLIKSANYHPRVNILNPGPGVGGHCIAVDPWFIVNSAPEEAQLIRKARLINDNKPDFVFRKIQDAITKTGRKKSELNISCLGLTFKSDIDDLRESPALKIAQKICKMKFNRIFLVEPNITEVPLSITSVNKISSLNDALKMSDIVLLLVDHEQFKTLDLNLLSGKQIIDTRGIWDIESRLE
tara:strand:- start:335 stop:1600 length:1266 start_codon:yes stop_codon:yes gene_type:complete